jgi:hypothetical protein
MYFIFITLKMVDDLLFFLSLIWDTSLHHLT